MTCYNPWPSSGTAFRQCAVSNASSSFLSHRMPSNSSQRGRQSLSSHYASSSALSGAAVDCRTRYSPGSDRQSFSVASEFRRDCVGALST